MRTGVVSPKITIDHVASEAGVSKTTVSRYLNGKYDKLSDQTRLRIEEVIQRLDYHPNRLAQSLKSHSSRSIGCVVSDVGSPFSSILMKGINSVCMENGYQLLLADSENDPEHELQAIKNLMNHQVDGLIINSTGKNDAWILNLSKTIPVVLADRQLSVEGELDTVCTDNYDSTYNCLRYLKKLGYTKIGFFAAGVETVMPRVLRYKAFCEMTARELGYDGKQATYLYDTAKRRDDCLDKLSRFVTSFPDERIAAFCVNGVVLLEVLQAVKTAGIQIGADFGICGYDNWGWADLIGPGITTIMQDSHREGAEAARLLIERIQGGKENKPRTIMLKNRMELRGSTVSR